MARRGAGLLLVTVAIVSSPSCGGDLPEGASSEGFAAATPRSTPRELDALRGIQPQEAGPWFVVSAEELEAVGDLEIGAVGFPGTAPRVVQRAECPRLAEASGLAPSGGIVVVETVVGPGGRIARARALTGDTGSPFADVLAECLAEWRFEPAVRREDGRPWPVYSNQVLQVEPE